MEKIPPRIGMSHCEPQFPSGNEMVWLSLPIACLRRSWGDVPPAERKTFYIFSPLDKYGIGKTVLSLQPSLVFVAVFPLNISFLLLLGTPYVLYTPLPLGRSERLPRL